MEGYLLLADGTRLDGVLRGAAQTAIGWLVANTSVVGFQEMVTDPTYRDTILAFTYPEVGNVGVAETFAESAEVQTAAVVVKVLSEHRSHYLAEDDFEHLLSAAGVPCLCDADTRGLAVHLREEGEMAAAVAPAETDPAQLQEPLAKFQRPEFRATTATHMSAGNSGPVIAVLSLGIRRSQLDQLERSSRPVVLPFDASPQEVLDSGATGVYISDGPGVVEPPAATVDTLRELAGRMPMLAAGLGHLALGQALGCTPVALRRGHHGANCPVRNLREDDVAVTFQRHSVVLDRDSVTASPEVDLVWENLNDGTVEGISACEGAAVGLQFMPVPSFPGNVHPQVADFVARASAD